MEITTRNFLVQINKRGFLFATTLGTFSLKVSQKWVRSQKLFWNNAIEVQKVHKLMLILIPLKKLGKKVI
jgi:hypothetical protein